MKLSSSAFSDGEKIPPIYTCKGQDINPPLKIEGVPEKARSLVLIMDDPDVPKFVREDQMWVHWIVYNIPPSIKEIVENQIPPGLIGKGTGGKMSYQGPCPPDREHRYFFKLYALDTTLALPAGKTKDEVMQAIKDHILEQAVLIGKFG